MSLVRITYKHPLRAWIGRHLMNERTNQHTLSRCGDSAFAKYKLTWNIRRRLCATQSDVQCARAHARKPSHKWRASAASAMSVCDGWAQCAMRRRRRRRWIGSRKHVAIVHGLLYTRWWWCWCEEGNSAFSRRSVFAYEFGISWCSRCVFVSGLSHRRVESVIVCVCLYVSFNRMWGN